MTPRENEPEDLLMRLRRIEGQVRGLQRMIEERRNCEDIITQIIAVRAALDRVGLLAIQRHIDECLPDCSEQTRATLGRAFELLMKLPPTGTL